MFSLQYFLGVLKILFCEFFPAADKIDLSDQYSHKSLCVAVSLPKQLLEGGRLRRLRLFSGLERCLQRFHFTGICSSIWRRPGSGSIARICSDKFQK